MTCGHPPPLLLGDDWAGPLLVGHTAPPLGRGDLCGDCDYEVETFPFARGDLLLLYTDAVLEARDARGEFYPLTARVRAWGDEPPDRLLGCLRDDLVAHARGRLGDDAAAIAIRRRGPSLVGT
ncbi:PP2C family protein-serine/threonine phosphatase [Streptomyces sp. NPDC047079]|uniref:PP2C family protein-serine/threonine phosphatase n=1 Tax=Streptomyces sp. NPDC047079 TaxID=3154607 RepID=UPI0033CAE787